MNMKNYHSAAALLLAAAMLAGCSSGSTENQAENQAGDNTNKTEVPADAGTAPEDFKTMIQTLKDNASDDDKALEAWQDLLSFTAESLDFRFEVGTDGDDYEYQDKGNTAHVKDNRVYEVGREAIFYAADDTTSYAVDLTDVDNSYDDLIDGFGTIDRYGPEALQTTVKVTESEHDTIKGTLKSSSDNSGELKNVTKQEAAIDLLMDSISGSGYIRTADPFHNASLYSMDVEDKDGETVVTLKVSDTDALRKASSVKAVLYNNRTERPVLGMNEIEDDTWTFRFNKDGVLREVENNADHVLYTAGSDSQTAYLSILNKTEIEKGDADKFNVKAVDDYINQVKDGTLKDGDSFELADWD